ncbi:hypothetical protein FIV00_02945 [Labrenzia sp. THAF82]|nr:hypothetical protein FIV00_02945 [Labrenzia sp. THAF82]
MQYTGASIKTVSRCLKSLVEAGILAYRDSPTGRRYVYRKNDGTPDEAYGLDFTPACFNLATFAVLADDYREALNRERNAKRAVTRLSRAIIDLVEAAGSDFSDYATHAEKLVAELRHDPEACTEWLQALYDDALMAVESLRQKTSEKASKQAEMSPAGGQNVPRLYNTTQSPSVFIGNKRTCSNEQEVNLKTDNGCAVEMALDEEPCGAGREAQHLNEQAETSENSRSGRRVGDTLAQSDTDVAYGAEKAPEKEQAEPGGGKLASKHPQKRPSGANFLSSASLDAVSISLLESACTAVQSDFGLSLASWPELVSAAEVMLVGIGLSEPAYAQAFGRLGRQAAAAILAVVAEKALRDPEKISSPGGYFRACCDRAAEGKLALAKSLFGLAAK